MSSRDTRPCSTSRSAAAATNGLVTLAIRNRDPGCNEPVATQLLDAGGHLEVDPEPRREDVQQSPRHLRPRRQIGVDQRLEPFLVAHAAKGAKPVQGRTCSRAAPIRNAVTSS